MNARKFDALAKAITTGGARSSRRRVLRGMAILAAISVTPGAARAFDGGVTPVQAPVGGVQCLSGADCAAGEICLNGACAPRDATGLVTGTDASGTIPVTVGDTTATTPVTPPTTPETGVGGLIQPGAPLPARIYAGRCGALGADPAFQLIDVGSVEGVEEGETPQGALTAIPAEFSTTVVDASLDELLAAEHAIDVRVDDANPATSIACGDIGGPVEAGAQGEELAVGLQERGESAYAGIGWLQADGDRTVVRVFLARGLEGGVVVTEAQTAAVETVTEPVPSEAEAAQAATPGPVVAAPVGAGTTVVTTIDVNLRAEPADDATVITILGSGVTLEVTGTPENGWVPVLEPASGQRGFVSDQFVAVAT